MIFEMLASILMFVSIFWAFLPKYSQISVAGFHLSLHSLIVAETLVIDEAFASLLIYSPLVAVLPIFYLRYKRKTQELKNIFYIILVWGLVFSFILKVTHLPFFLSLMILALSVTTMIIPILIRRDELKDEEKEQ